MCGIFGIVQQQTNSAKIILTALKKLEYRGYDSWGIAVQSNPKLSLFRRVGKIGAATSTDLSLPASQVGIGHTRWATHGGVTVANAHPHVDESQQLAIVHNGIVENYLELKQELIKQGLTFTSQTDTEVIIQLISLQRKKLDLLQAVKAVFKQLTGLNAIVVLDNSTGELVAIRQGSPLILGIGNDSITLASDPVALVGHAHHVHYLEENEVIHIKGQTASLSDLDTQQERKLRLESMPMTEAEVSKHPFSSYMLKEINDQPEILQHVTHRLTPAITDLARTMSTYRQTWLVGCGSASYAALFGSYIFSRLANHPGVAITGGEFGHFRNLVKPDTLSLFISQSGETIDIVEHAVALTKKNLPIAAIVNRVGSTLDRMTTNQVKVGAGPEICVLTTKVMTAQLAILLRLAGAMANQLDQVDRDIISAIQAIRSLLTVDRVPLWQQVASLIAQASSSFSIGRGLAHPVALEGALKIKEVSYRHMEGFAAGELKHGVISLIEPGIPTLVFVQNDETKAETLSNAIEIKARGGTIIGIAPENHEAFDIYLEYQDAGLASALPQIVIAQLIAYYLAEQLGLDPDKPRNLAKSVVVR